jgi:hypothetical protein
MADGRMLSKRVTRSNKIADLSSDTARMIYSWLIPYTDVEGRMEADPRLLKADIAPLLDHITPTVINNVLHELHKIGLILLYSAGEESKKYLQVTKFEENQKNLRKDREAPSRIPAPSPAKVRSKSGATPAELPPNIREEKLREENIRPADAAPISPSKKESKAKKKIKTSLPKNFEISEAVKTWAAKKGFKRLDEHFESFKAKCMAHGYQYINWDYAFQEAIREDWAKLNTGGGNGRHGEGGYGIQPTGRAMPKEYRGEDIPPPDEQTRKDNIERARALTRTLASHNIPSGNT